MVKQVPMLLVAVVALGLVPAASAANLEELSNFHQYSPQFASSGQPSTKQLQDVKDAGFERVIYLAFSENESAIDDEDGSVTELGMDYIHIPVDWGNPTSSNFYAFAGIMQTGPPQKTLLHCQVNFRASTFSFLYRVIYLDVDVSDAKEDLNLVWQPNETWRNFIFDVLQENNISPECAVCDWTPGQH